MLTSRWAPLRYHRIQEEYDQSRARFTIVCAGRRSGKTERAKRRLIKRALKYRGDQGRFWFTAPTQKQARKIYWEDLKAFVPPSLRTGRPSESRLELTLATGTRIAIGGMDEPERMEGDPIHGIVLDEYAKMKEVAWTNTIRPAVSTLGAPGWVDFVGKPVGRNHFYELMKRLDSEPDRKFENGGSWKFLTWESADILPPEEIEAAMDDLDSVTFAQEYRARFTQREGRAYGEFGEPVHARIELAPYYDPRRELILTFDFNRKPGTAAILQEFEVTAELRAALPDVKLGGSVTLVLGEVWIASQSTTKDVCEKLMSDWGNHLGEVTAYGDPSGGYRTTQSVAGSDWDMIEGYLAHADAFGDRFTQGQRRGAYPPHLAIVNATNNRLRTASGLVRMLVCPTRAPHIVADYNDVTLVPGAVCKIDKDSAPMLTHLSDGIACYLVQEHPPLGAGETFFDDLRTVGR